MLIKLIEITRTITGQHKVCNVFVNPKHVVTLREDDYYKKDLIEGNISLDLNQNAEFTRITLSEAGRISELTVIGNPSEIQAKFFSQQKTLLRG